jgi:hypothetical protein
MITGMTKHFMFHIRWISIVKLLYFNFFLDSFCITFLSDGISTYISKKIVYLFVFNYYVGPIFQNLPISLYPLIPQYCYIFILTFRLRYVGVPVFCCFSA